MDTAKTCLITYEKTQNYSGINITGLADEQLQNDDFKMDLMIISAEINISDYINPKTSALIKVVKKSYEKYNENKIFCQLNNNLNDINKLEKLKSL